MVNYPREKTPEEINAALHEQVDILRGHCKAYDQGKVYYAKPISATLYLLLHRDGQVPLLHKAGLLKSAQITSSAYDRRYAKNGGLFLDMPLCEVVITQQLDGAEFKYRPKLGNDILGLNHAMKFSKWYDEKIFRPASGKEMSRKNLIHFVRSTDGGGHFDPVEKNPDYDVLKVEGFGLVMENADGGRRFANDAHLASIRQIAWELDQFLIERGF